MPPPGTDERASAIPGANDENVYSTTGVWFVQHAICPLPSLQEAMLQPSVVAAIGRYGHCYITRRGQTEPEGTKHLKSSPSTERVWVPPPDYRSGKLTHLQEAFSHPSSVSIAQYSQIAAVSRWRPCHGSSGPRNHGGGRTGPTRSGPSPSSHSRARPRRAEDVRCNFPARWLPARPDPDAWAGCGRTSKFPSVGYVITRLHLSANIRGLPGLPACRGRSSSLTVESMW